MEMPIGVGRVAGIDDFGVVFFFVAMVMVMVRYSVPHVRSSEKILSICYTPSVG